MRRLPVRYLLDAAADLDSIFDHLLDQGASPRIARAFVERIEVQCERIGGLPEGYPAHPDLGPGIRISPFERSAVIAYRLAGDAVEIVNVFYGGRDYQSLLGDKPT